MISLNIGFHGDLLKEYFNKIVKELLDPSDRDHGTVN